MEEKKSKKYFSVLTMGCRVNQVETQRLRQGGQTMGYYPTDCPTLADLIIINTCSVTSESDRQARQLIRRCVRDNPQAKLVVTGCYAQRDPKLLGDISGVNLVLGNPEKGQLWQHLEKQKTEPEKIVVSAISDQKTVGDVPLVTHFSNRARAFLQVQDGCDHHCTFCTIPSVRGPSRSLSVDHIVAQAEQYLESGYQELVLTGINLGAYGRDLSSNHSLANLVKKLSYLKNMNRLRLSSLDPNDLDNALIEQFANTTTVCPHLHLSVQSGDDIILKRMGRGYGRDLVLDKVKHLRKMCPEIVLGADIIVGFPTEDKMAFQNTLDLIESANLVYLHVFRYSDRPDTPAAAIPKRFRVSFQEIQQRSEKTRQIGVKLHKQTAIKWIGKTVSVLVEILKESLAEGKTTTFLTVQFPTASTLKPGELHQVKIINFEQSTNRLLGELI